MSYIRKVSEEAGIKLVLHRTKVVAVGSPAASAASITYEETSFQ